MKERLESIYRSLLSLLIPSLACITQTNNTPPFFPTPLMLPLSPLYTPFGLLLQCIACPSFDNCPSNTSTVSPQILSLPHSFAPRLDAAVHIRNSFNHFEKQANISDAGMTAASPSYPRDCLHSLPPSFIHSYIHTYIHWFPTSACLFYRCIIPYDSPQSLFQSRPLCILSNIFTVILEGTRKKSKIGLIQQSAR